MIQGVGPMRTSRLRAECLRCARSDSPVGGGLRFRFPCKAGARGSLTLSSKAGATSAEPRRPLVVQSSSRALRRGGGQARLAPGQLWESSPSDDAARRGAAYRRAIETSAGFAAPSDPTGVKLRSRAWAAPADSYAAVQPAGLEVKWGHSDVVLGEVVALYRHAGGLFALSPLEADLRADAELYYSAESVMAPEEGGGRELLALALTAEPAQSSPRPLQLWPGRPRDVLRGGHLDWDLRRTVERGIPDAAQRRDGTPIRILERSRAPHVERVPGGVLVDGETRPVRIVPRGRRFGTVRSLWRVDRRHASVRIHPPVGERTSPTGG
jgi:hypothetical protein